MISCMGTIGAGTVQGIAGKITYIQENTPKNLFVRLENGTKEPTEVFAVYFQVDKPWNPVLTGIFVSVN